MPAFLFSYYAIGFSRRLAIVFVSGGGLVAPVFITKFNGFLLFLKSEKLEPEISARSFNAI